MANPIKQQYQTWTGRTELNTLVQYMTPRQYFDPRKQIYARETANYKNKPKQGKFKSNTKHKKFFGEQIIKPFTKNPSPDKYKTVTQGMFGQFNASAQKTKRAKSSASLQKVNPKITRGSYIDDIEKFQEKHKPPGVGKYEVGKQPFKKQEKQFSPKSKQQSKKISSLDDVKFLSNQIPGCGHYNPHIEVPHLRENRTTYKQFIVKHKQEQQKRKQLISTNLGPATYTPVKVNTFDEYAKNKQKPKRSNWAKFEVDIRKGVRSHYKSPSPAEHHLINQWSSKDPKQRETSMGKVKLYERISKSVKSLSVYH